MCPGCGHETGGTDTAEQSMDEATSLALMLTHLRDATRREVETIPPGALRLHPPVAVWAQWNGLWKTQDRPRGGPGWDGPTPPWTREPSPPGVDSTRPAEGDTSPGPVGTGEGGAAAPDPLPSHPRADRSRSPRQITHPPYGSER